MRFDGKRPCVPCNAFGRIDRCGTGEWLLCKACDGTQREWEPGGPMFDSTLVLGERTPGEYVVLASGHRARVQFHMPRSAPETTFVTLVSDFDGTEDHCPKPCDSRLGVRTVDKFRPYVRDVGNIREANLDDPLVRVSRAVKGSLL